MANKTFTLNSPVGTCTYEYKNKLHSFRSVTGEHILGYDLPSNFAADSILSTDGDIMDTCRGLLDIVAAAAWEPKLGAALKNFRGVDAFIPTFIGNYHSCFLENTPWSDGQLKSIKGLFSPAGAAYFDKIISMYVDCGSAVVISPLTAALKK